MKLIIGLGNPGTEYEKTRHNVGFLALDYLHEQGDFSNWKKDKRANALIAESGTGDNKVILAKPQTFMNESGTAVQSLVVSRKLSVDDVTIIHDDIDIAFGTVKKHVGKGSAGHNGIKSIIEHLGTKDFTRIRIGVLPTNIDKSHIDTKAFVLKNFSKEELEQLPKLFKNIFHNK